MFPRKFFRSYVYFYCNFPIYWNLYKYETGYFPGNYSVFHIILITMFSIIRKVTVCSMSAFFGCNVKGKDELSNYEQTASKQTDDHLWIPRTLGRMKQGGEIGRLLHTGSSGGVKAT